MSDTDRELLEMAAKAAGLEVVGLASKYVAQGCTEWALIVRNDSGGDSVFDPITDNGDALWLAVTLGTNPMWGGFDVEICREHSGARNFCYVEPHGADPYAATRRAIVRAAAAIGGGK